MKKALFVSIFCLLLAGLMGTIAHASNLDWTTTSVEAGPDNMIFIRGYFTNNRADRIITRVDWFNPRLTLTYPNGYVSVIEGQYNGEECYIESDCTYEMNFCAVADSGWTRWSLKPTFHYRYKTIRG